jgi:two-component system sensor histidine kinase PhoQ
MIQKKLTAYLARILQINSLLGRFIAASLVLLPVFIFTIGTALIDTFEYSQLDAEEETLQAQLYGVLSVTELENNKISLPPVLTEPKFNQQLSGLYGFIYNPLGEELWRSKSAELLTESLYQADNNFTLAKTLFNTITIDKTQQFNRFSYDIEWVNDDETTSPLRIVIAHDATILTTELNSYKKRLWQWLSIMTIALITIQLFIMLWGLRPLKRLSTQLKELYENKIEVLDDGYPIEILPVTKNFNTILLHEKNQRERYRNTLSDLAHSLKTPLAVIQSHLDSQAFDRDVIGEQVTRIDQIISHQLKRASINANQNSISGNSNRIQIKPCVHRLTTVLQKVYKDKKILFNNTINEEIFFTGDEADLLELLGNILDNACKYGETAVTISAQLKRSNLQILISDDGKGITEKLQTTLLNRGERGDTALTGQGIGLSIVTDILSSYGGGLALKNNMPAPHLKGCCFFIELPISALAIDKLST